MNRSCGQDEQQKPRRNAECGLRNTSGSRTPQSALRDPQCHPHSVAPPDLATLFQFLTRYSAVRQASACTVSVGLCAPLVPITEAPRTPRFGDSWEKPQRLTTFVSILSPMRVPPYACVETPIAPPAGARWIAIAPASRYHCSILS